jgi:hypothetical protein
VTHSFSAKAIYKNRSALDILIFSFGNALFLREVLAVSNATINFKIISFQSSFD